MTKHTITEASARDSSITLKRLVQIMTYTQGSTLALNMHIKVIRKTFHKSITYTFLSSDCVPSSECCFISSFNFTVHQHLVRVSSSWNSRKKNLKSIVLFCFLDLGGNLMIYT